MSEAIVSSSDIASIRQAMCDYIQANGTEATVYRRTVSQDDLGEETETWSTVATYMAFIRLRTTANVTYRDGQNVAIPSRQLSATFCWEADVQAGDKACIGSACYLLEEGSGGPLQLDHTFVLKEVR